MHIALATVQFDQVSSGPGTFAHYLASSSPSNELTLFSQDVQQPSRQVRRVSRSPLKGRPGGQFARSWAYHQSLKAEYRTHPCDLIWYNASPKTGFFSAVLESAAPVVLMINDYNNAISRWPLGSRKELGLRESLKRPVWHGFEKWALHACDAVVVNSEFMRSKIAGTYGLPHEKTHLLYKAVDTSQFVFQPERRFEAPLRVLFVKSDYVRGGLTEVIKAMRDVPFATRLAVAGPEKSAAPSIRGIAQQNGYTGAVHLCGRVSRERMRGLFQENDVLCVPSHAEALGVVFLEAMASGLPAIGSTAGGIPEVLDEGRAGWLAEPYQAESVRAALIAVMQDEAERRQKVEHGREYVRRFSVESMTQRFDEIAKAVAASRHT